MHMVKGYYTAVAKALLANADRIVDAIDRYLAKADDELEETLSEEGYALPDETVDSVNTLQEDIADILSSQTVALVAAASSVKNDDWDRVKENVDNMLKKDDVAEQVADASLDMLEVEVPNLATVYIVVFHIK